LLPITLRLAATACLLLAAALPVRAQDRLECQVDPLVGAERPAVAETGTAAGDEEIQLEAGAAELALGGGASFGR